MKSPVVLLRSLMEDLHRLHPGVVGLDRDFHTIEHRFEDEGFSFLSKTLPLLGDSFVEGLSRGVLTCPRNFSKVPRGTIPRLLSGMFCHVFDSYTGVLKEDAPSDIILSIYQICFVFKKCLTDTDSSDELDEAAVDTFFETDNMVARDLPYQLAYQLETMSKCVLPFLETGIEEIHMKHGPGAVFEGYTTNSKWSEVWRHVKEYDALSEFGFDTIAIFDRMDSSSILSDSTNRLSLKPPMSEPSGSCARLVTVPKNSSSRRTITVEPVLKQFYQQGLNTHLRNNILKCNILSNCLALSNQSKNNELARIGSITDEYATIDLKHASDLLSTRLVEACFYERGLFLQHIFDSRSRYVLRNKTPHELRKFAGMGNALTFPVQSVVFAMVSIASILSQDGLSPSYRNVKAASRHIQVYGDDIIVRSQYASSVVSGLESAGLIVNRRKSFLNGNFKESCGTDYYKGVDIAPVYIRSVPETHLEDAKLIGQMVSTCNQFWLRGYYKTSDAMKDMVEQRLGRRLPLSRSSATGLGWHSHMQYSHATRWCNELHTWLVKRPCIRAVRKKDPISGYPALLKSLLTPLLGRDVAHLETVPVRHKTKVSMRWVLA